MKQGVKNIHFIFILILILVLLRVELIINSYYLFFKYIFFFFSNPSAAFSIMDFAFADLLLSILLVVIIPITLLILNRKYNFALGILNKRLTSSSFIILLLITFFLFAPLISDSDPNFQKDLNTTKLLPPLSSLDVILMKKQREHKGNKFSDLLFLKNEIVKKSFNENLIFADSVKIGENVIFYQKGKETVIQKNKLELANNLPVVQKKYFLLGTDQYGRDIFSRLVYGTRISLFIGFGAVIISLILGLALGFLAGYPGGFIDSALNRVTEVFLAFPIIFLIILIIAFFGNSFLTVMIVLGFSGWMGLFKIVRGEILSLKKKDFFLSAQMIGLTKRGLLLKEILPVILAPVIVNLILLYGNVILAESALSYLGLGVADNYPSWGAMIQSGQAYINKAWWMIFFPGLALFLTLFAANNLGKEIQMFYNPSVER